MLRVSVVGNTGAGKSTLATELARRLGVQHVELDAIYHQRDWQPLPRDDFRERVSERLRADGWVVDGNYASGVQDLVWNAADTVVWLDLPRRVIMPALALRTLGRMLRGTELWNGNRERFRNLFDRRPEENILLWAWTHHAHYRARYAAARDDPQWHQLRFVHLRSRREARAWLERRCWA